MIFPGTSAVISIKFTCEQCGPLLVVIELSTFSCLSLSAQLHPVVLPTLHQQVIEKLVHKLTDGMPSSTEVP